MHPSPDKTRYAFNRTRNTPLAAGVCLANTHWSRLVGLLATNEQSFRSGQGLWIVPCHGVHTLGMRFPIDVAYLDGRSCVVHVEHSLKPWRIAPVRRAAQSVLELPSETLLRTGTSIGDEIEIEVSSKAAVEIALS